MLLLSGKVGLQRLMLPLAFVQCWCPTCKALVAVDALAYLNHMNMSIIMYLYIYGHEMQISSGRLTGM